MPFTWVFDAPTGTYKNRALSSKLYAAALAEAHFVEHTLPQSEFGKKKGESITITRVRNLNVPTNAKLDELRQIPEDELALATTSITVSEWGRAVPFTSFSADLSEFNIENSVQNALKNQLKLVLDNAAAAAFKQAKVKYVPTGAATNSITTNGVPGATASANLNMWHVEEIRDYMYDTLNIPPAVGDDYVAIFRTLGLRGLKRDADWKDWYKYTDPSTKFNSEVGRVEGIRFIETNNSGALGKVGTGSVLGEGVVFGADSVAMAEVLTPELRAKMPTDYGRSLGVAWYGIFEFGLIWDTGNVGEARVVHVTSA